MSDVTSITSWMVGREHRSLRDDEGNEGNETWVALQLCSSPENGQVNRLSMSMSQSEARKLVSAILNALDPKEPQDNGTV